MAGKFNVEKAKAAGYSDEEINAFLANNPQLQPNDGMTGNLATDIKQNIGRIASETIRDAAPAVRSATQKIANTLRLPETGQSTSVARNVITGLPRAAVETAGDLVADNVTPTGLAMNLVTGGASIAAKPVLKATSQGIGKAVSGKSMKDIGRLFDEPGAMISGAIEKVTGGAAKAFAKAKKASNIRNIKGVEESLESGLPVVKKNVQGIKSGRMARKQIAKLEKQIADTEEVLNSARPVPQSNAAREAVQRATERMAAAKARVESLRPMTEKIGERALEGRQSLDEVLRGVSEGKPIKDFNLNRVRRYLNQVLDVEAPAVRAADTAVSKAKIGQEFLQLLPEGLTRRIVSSAGAGGALFNPALIAPTVAMSPFTTGVATSLAGVAGKGIEGLTRTQLRRALISALASRSNPQDGE